jgi:hypothetical protein
MQNTPETIKNFKTLWSSRFFLISIDRGKAIRLDKHKSISSCLHHKHLLISKRIIVKDTKTLMIFLDISI